jgi:hypothetical protein
MIREKEAVPTALKADAAKKAAKSAKGYNFALLLAYAVRDGAEGWRKTEPPRRDGA